MQPSRTLQEHAAEERLDGRGNEMDFAATDSVTSDDVKTTGPTVRDSKTIDRRAY